MSHESPKGLIDSDELLRSIGIDPPKPVVHGETLADRMWRDAVLNQKDAEIEAIITDKKLQEQRYAESRSKWQAAQEARRK